MTVILPDAGFGVRRLYFHKAGNHGFCFLLAMCLNLFCLPPFYLLVKPAHTVELMGWLSRNTHLPYRAYQYNNRLNHQSIRGAGGHLEWTATAAPGCPRFLHPSAQAPLVAGQFLKSLFCNKHHLRANGNIQDCSRTRISEDWKNRRSFSLSLERGKCDNTTGNSFRLFVQVGFKPSCCENKPWQQQQYSVIPTKHIQHNFFFINNKTINKYDYPKLT